MDTRIAAAVATLVLIGVPVLSGCSSDDTAQVTTTSTATGASKLVGPEAFARVVDQPGVVTVNVHVPHGDDIAGTDLAVPFDQVATSTALPADRATPLAVYCRSGNMSATAVKDLRTMGFTDVTELAGGYDAWLGSGRTMEAAATG